MNIISNRIYTYALKLDRSLQVKGKEIKKREGIILALTNEQGAEGYGEISPLPGISDETFEKALFQSKKICDYLLENSAPEKFWQLDGQFEQWLGNLKLYPSVRFGIEMAYLTLAANTFDKPIFDLIANGAHKEIHVNGLLIGDKSTVAKQAQAMLKQGYRGMKLKIGQNLDADIEKVKAINDIISGKAILHLDANQSMSFDDAITFGKKIGPAAVDYIEEPFAQQEKIPEFYTDTFIPVALDETVKSINFQTIKKIEGVDIIVLKPTILGGIEKTYQIMQNAQNQGIDSVISSSFESSIGITMLAHLAGTSSRDINAGLDTTKWFKKDLLKPALSIKRGKIDLTHYKIDRTSIDFENLTQIKYANH